MMDEDFDDPYLRESYRHYTQELLHDTSMTNQVQAKYWTAKSFVKKLKKKEDESVVAADADLDAKLEFYKSIQDTTHKLIYCIERYQDAIMALSQEENKLGRFLKEQSQIDKSPAGKMMNAIGKQLSQTSQQRLSCRVPLVRLYGDLDTFRNRAISDTALSVQRMEALRTEYRGALLWMKDISQELNPDAYRQLERFRKVQAQVKINRDRFEKNKYAVCQKIDLLGASRCNLLSHDLEVYHQNMLNFWQKTAKEMGDICEQFKGHQHYEWSMLKELNEPSLKLHENLEKNMQVEEKAEAGAGPAGGVSGDGEEGKPEDAPASGDPGLAQERLISWEDKLMEKDDETYFEAETSAADLLSSLNASPGAAPDPAQGSSSTAHTSSVPTGSVSDGDLFDDADDFFNQIMNSGTSAGGEADGDPSSDWKNMFGGESGSGSQAALGGGFEFASGQSSFLPSQLMEMAQTGAGAGSAAMNLPTGAPATLGGLGMGTGAESNSSMSSINPFQPHSSLTSTSPHQQSSLNANKLQGMSDQKKQGAVSRPMQGAPGKQSQVPGAGKPKDMTAWFNLFADLDPLANPDAVGDSKQEGKIGI